MPGRKNIVVIVFIILLLSGQQRIVSAGQARTQSKNSSSVTEVLRVSGKGADHIIVGEQRLYVIPGISSLVSSTGTAIELGRLRTPCLAEISYVGWIKGVEKRPVVVHLKVKRVYPGASSETAQE
jgi:hypothetical protein